MTNILNNGEKNCITHDIGILAVLTLITILLSVPGKVFNLSQKNPAFFIAIAFMVAFGIWYGWKGILATYLGCFFALLIIATMMALPSIPYLWALVFSLADAIEVAIPALAFWYFKANPDIRRIKDLTIYLIFGLILNTLVGAFVGTMIVFSSGMNKTPDMVAYLASWAGGDMILIFLITSLLLSFGTPYLRAKGWLKGEGIEDWLMN